ncbi:MAG: hypothetical protein HOP29_10495 [Phycisphaerales bacterium]|nr:hypothetical protein [Phycisphaerales bacterium]
MTQGKKLAVAICILLMGAAPVLADMTVTMSRGPGNGPGGEFYATYSGFSPAPISLGGLIGAFETFCIEKNEYINFHSTYYIAINDEADAGGKGGGTPDPLDSRTAYLYEQFITGQLTGYNYTNTTLRKGSADALQDIFWYLENEQDWNATWTSGTLQYAFYQDAVANHTPGDIGNVHVMNMYKNSDLTGRAQDQLVYFGEPVPAPGAAVLAMVGMAFVGRIRRRTV